ncbi:MAG: hypothetical protein PUH02_07395 [bacterium]|nr:hypothetical protein [bacterium]
MCHFMEYRSYQRQIDDCGVVPVAISQAAPHFLTVIVRKRNRLCNKITI